MLNCQSAMDENGNHAGYSRILKISGCTIKLPFTQDVSLVLMVLAGRLNAVKFSDYKKIEKEKFVLIVHMKFGSIWKSNVKNNICGCKLSSSANKYAFLLTMWR